MYTVPPVSVYVIHSARPKPAIQITPVDRLEPISFSLSDRIMTLLALSLAPQTILSPVRLLHEVQTDLFGEEKAFFTPFKKDWKDERPRGRKEEEE